MIEKTDGRTVWQKVRRPIFLCICGCLLAVSIAVSIFVSFDLLSTPTSMETPEVVSNETDTESKITIVAFGDSVTAGYGIALESAYPRVLEKLLSERGYDVRVVNAGVSGETSAGGLRRVDFIKSQKPDIVVLALGGNDVLRGLSPEETKNNLYEIITSLRRDGIAVLLVGMYAPNNLGGIYEAQFNSLYPALSVELEVPFVPFLLEGVALQKDLNQSDGIHPNEAGAKIIAEKNILPALMVLLEDKM